MTTQTITATAKPFAAEPRGTYRFQLDSDTIRVWDSVAKHYTLCHSLSPRAQARIRRLAATK